MEVTTPESEVRSDIKMSWAIYGGHISGRRLRGIKINPIYQDYDCDPTGNGSNRQSDVNWSFGELHIDTYESLPRNSFIRPSSSVPNIPQPCPSSSPCTPYVCNGIIAYLGDREQEEDTPHFSDFSLPRTRRGDDAHDAELETSNTSKVSSSDGDREHTHPWSWPQSERGYRKQVIRQIGLEATSDEPHVTVKKEPFPPTSKSVSSGTSLPPFASPKCSPMKRRGAPKVYKNKVYPLKKQLSVLQEQSSIVENEQDDMNDTEVLTFEADDQSANPASIGRNVNNETQHIDTENQNFSHEICHTLSFTDGEDNNGSKLFSSNKENDNFFNNTVNYCYRSFDVNVSSHSSNKQNLALSQNTPVLALNNFTMLPSCSDIHNSPFVTSDDHVNSINASVLNLMLQKHVDASTMF